MDMALHKLLWMYISGNDFFNAIVNASNEKMARPTAGPLSKNFNSQLLSYMLALYL